MATSKKSNRRSNKNAKAEKAEAKVEKTESEGLSRAEVKELRKSLVKKGTLNRIMKIDTALQKISEDPHIDKEEVESVRSVVGQLYASQSEGWKQIDEYVEANRKSKEEREAERLERLKKKADRALAQAEKAKERYEETMARLEKIQKSERKPKAKKKIVRDRDE